MFAILQYVVKLVIKPIIFSPISRQLVLTWQAVCTQIVVRGLKCCQWPKYEDDVITQYWVMANFICIHYVPVWPWPLTYFPQNWVTWLEGRDEYMCLFGSLWTSSYLKYEAIIFIFSCLVVNHFISHSLEHRPHVSSKYELDRTTQYWVIAIFNLIRYVTLWPWPLIFSP